MATRLLLEGPDLEALLDQVRTEHGSNARIVSADRLRKGGVGGFFSKQWFELGVELPETPQPESPAPDSVEALLSLVDLVDLADASDDQAVSTPSEPGELSEQPVLPDLADLPRCTATVVPTPAPTFQDVLASVDGPGEPAEPAPARPVSVPTPSVVVPAPTRPATAYAAWTAAATTPEPVTPDVRPTTALVPSAPTALVPTALVPTTAPVAPVVDPLAARAKAAARVKAAARAKAAATDAPSATPTGRTAAARKPAARKPATRTPAARSLPAAAPRRAATARTLAPGTADELLVGLPGRVFVVAGALPTAIRVAESVAARLRLAPNSILVAGPAETDHARRVYGPEHAATLAAELKSGGPVVVAVDAPVDLPDGGQWAGAIADALGADVLVAVIDGTRRPEDLRRHLDDLGPVSAVAVHGTTTADHAAELDLPAIAIA